MIKDITGGPGIVVSGNYGHPYISPGAQSAGMTRYNTSTQNMEVYDGNAWLTMSSTPSVSLDIATMEVLSWARSKMIEEQNLKSLMEKHPGLKDTYEKFEIMKALCSQDDHNAAA